MKRRMRLCFTVTAATLLVGPAALAGPEWVEPTLNDAGSLPGSAAHVEGDGSTVQKIKGHLTPMAFIAGVGSNPGGGPVADDQDMFLIQIDDPKSFYASTSPFLGGNAPFDTQLYLFKVDGTGLLGNNDTFAQGDIVGNIIPQSTIWSFSNDGTEVVVSEPGLYLLAISTSATKPVSAGGDIFDIQFSGEVSGPDGQGGGQPISAWDIVRKAPPKSAGSGNPKTVEYEIALSGVVLAPIMQLKLDIAPGKCPNLYNTNNNGHTKVAILGAADFDVHTINLSTIRISRVDGVGGSAAWDNPPPAKFQDVSRPYTGGADCGCQTGGGDGFMDVEVKFKGQETTQALQLAGMAVGTVVPLKVTGQLNNGTQFVAYDCITISH